MLSAIVKEHQGKQSARKERQGKPRSFVDNWFFVRLIAYHEELSYVKTEQKRKEAVQAANNLTQALVDHLNVGWVLSKNMQWQLSRKFPNNSEVEFSESLRLTWIKRSSTPKQSSCSTAQQILRSRHSPGWTWWNRSPVPWRKLAMLRIGHEASKETWELFPLP